jgi:CheY-like chemotaxis protein
MVNQPPETQSADAAGTPLSKAASELNNLLQIMSSTTALIEKAQTGGDDSEKTIAMLRVSIERAEKVAADLVDQAGGSKEKTFVSSDAARFRKQKNTESGATTQCILLVDDEHMALTLVQRLLVEAGYQVVTAQSGFECLDLFRLRPYNFHLVLLDLTMPFMDGEETFQRLREIRPDTPVVLCTGFVQQDRLDRLMNAGLVGFLRKPLAPDEIVGFVRSVLQSVRYSGGTAKSASISPMI